MTKTCSKCLTPKPLEDFGFASGGNYQRSECRKCEYDARKLRTSLRQITPTPPDGYVCPICLRSKEETAGLGNKKLGSWVLDHCHESKKFRGWVCHVCNRGLGAFKDEIERLERAIQYLKNAK